MTIGYSQCQTLAITRRGPDNTVLDIQMRALNGKLPTAGHEGHRELARIWRDAGPGFDTSLALEMMGFFGPDVKEGLASLRERRAPRF